MDKSSKACLQYLRKQRDTRIYDDLELKKSMFHLFKSECFDSTRYKWKVMSYTSFVNRNNLSYEYCQGVLEILLADFLNIQPFYVGEKGKKGFAMFVKTTSKKVDDDKKIKIDSNVEDSFLLALKNLKEDYFKDYPTGKYMDIIHKNFQIGNNNRHSTIERKYKEVRLK